MKLCIETWLTKYKILLLITSVTWAGEQHCICKTCDSALASSRDSKMSLARGKVLLPCYESIVFVKN
jgi:hypothetical protein